jgi:hypothetical protein
MEGAAGKVRGWDMRIGLSRRGAVRPREPGRIPQTGRAPCASSRVIHEDFSPANRLRASPPAFIVAAGFSRWKICLLVRPRKSYLSAKFLSDNMSKGRY